MWTGLIRLPFVRPDMSEDSVKPDATVRAYYEAIDAQNYDRFADLLAPDVVHERPDRTIEGRATLVEFVREGRPNEDTSHEIRGVFAASDGFDSGDGTGRDENAGADVAAEGRLLDSERNRMFEFVDVFAVGSEQTNGRRIEEIRTYTG
jgi:ketosteroid isomerase-like protein